MTFNLMPYQQTGCAFLGGRRAAALFDDPGLGKTAQTLMALSRGARVVVVCPKSVKAVWVDETRMWRTDLRTYAASGLGSFRWPAPGEIVILNYDILPDPTAARVVPPGVVLVADEAHALKRPGSRRTKRFRAISRGVRAAGGSVWLLTGTPLLDHPPDLWYVLEAADLASKTFGGWPMFCQLMGVVRKPQVIRGGRKILVNAWSGKVSPEVPHLLRRVSLRRRKADVLKDLPPKRYRQLTVDLPRAAHPWQRAVDTLFADKTSVALDAFAVGHAKKEQQEAVGSLLKELAQHKSQAAIEYAETIVDGGESCVVFSAHRAPIDAFRVLPGWGVITGDEAQDTRTALVKAFQDGRLVGLAGTIQAMGVGITLTRAAQVVFVDRMYTPALNLQAEDRLHRKGQANAVIVTDLVVDHWLDRRVRAIQLEKQRLVEASVDASAVSGG